MSALFPNSPPRHGGQLREIAARYGIPAEQLIDFSANINPAGPPTAVLAAIRSALEDPAILEKYPDIELIEAKRAISDFVGVKIENVAVANGFAPLLEAAIRSLKIKRCLLPVPSFSEYRTVLENSNAAVIPFALSSNGNFRYEPETILKTLLNYSCDAILLANPQNPSGTLCDAAKMGQLIQLASEPKIIVMLDEAFIDYCPSHTLTSLATQQSNAIVFRSVTKFFAVPGLRVAYAVSTSSSVQGMNRFIAPWPITSLASKAVCAALQDRTYAEESGDVNDKRRLWLESELARLKIATYPSSANFLLLRFSEVVDVDLLWEKMIIEERIVLRSCANFEGLAAGHLRIAVRSEHENERLIRGLERVLRSFEG